MSKMKVTLNRFTGYSRNDQFTFGTNNPISTNLDPVKNIVLVNPLDGGLFEYNKGSHAFDYEVTFPNNFIIPRNNFEITEGGPLGFEFHLYINDRMRFLSYISQYQLDILGYEFDCDAHSRYHYENHKASYRVGRDTIQNHFVSDLIWEDMDEKDRHTISLTFEGPADWTIIPEPLGSVMA